MKHNWFTIEQLDSDTYVISEPKHWEETHCYLLLGERRALLIDTGLGVLPLRPVVDALTSLPVTAVLTHAHWDHIGGFGEFTHRTCHELEAPWLSGDFPLPLSVVRANLMREPCDFPEEFDPDGYAIWPGGVSSTLADGQKIDLGGRTITALHTPGHSPGHLCYWEEERGALYSGDLIYRGKLDMFYPTTDPVKFLDSVRRVAALPVRVLRPGHFDLRIEPVLISQVLNALEDLAQSGKLSQGQGVFEFKQFALHL